MYVLFLCKCVNVINGDQLQYSHKHIELNTC